MLKNIEFILKVLVQKTLSTISIQIVENFEFMSIITKKMELDSDVFHNFKKIGFILKVSLQETLSTIFIHSRKFRIYVEERHL